jgi:hypothetical protein
MITVHSHNNGSSPTPITQCHDISNTSVYNVTIQYTDVDDNIQTIILARNTSISVCALGGTVSGTGGTFSVSTGNACDANYECETYNYIYLNADEQSGSFSHANACGGPTAIQAFSLDIQTLNSENLTSIIGKQIIHDQITHRAFNGEVFGGPGYYGIGSTYNNHNYTMTVAINSGGIITAAAICSPVTSTPTPTPFPTPTPSNSSPATIYKYIMNPCDEESPNFTAKSNSQKTIGWTYTCTGSAYAEDNYTIIATSTNPWVTTIGDVTTCAGDNNGECLLSGTQIEMHDGTSKNIEDIVIGDTVMSRSIETAPNSDDYGVLLDWSHANPKIESDLAQVTGKMAYWKNHIYNINSGLLVSSKDHLHFIKRGEEYTFTTANLLQVGDFLVDKDNTLIEITSVLRIQGNFQVWKIDVESLDTYIANGIITHNDKPRGFNP